jgi:hypothetical protein
MITDYQSKYIAYDLTRRRSSDSAERLAVAVAGAQVDMNPHQVDAALFAFASPLSKGALLADEVGLGKTIEAGLVISQRWAEGKRRILIIAPANLRKQWHQEMNEKFFIPCTILEAKSYNAETKTGNFKPFQPQESVVICSYQFARAKAADVAATPWDLVVIDEAHWLRNVYKPSNVIANTLKAALAERNKLLLTATPLQNSLLELFGLVSFIDEHSFGDLKSFREQFASIPQDRAFDMLRERLKPICHRTLRRQVTAYVPYTKRHAILQEFSPDEAEDKLYNLVTAYLQRDNLQALPSSQRALMTLVLRKLTAVDRLNIVAHDRFQEIVDEANNPNSPIRLKQLVLDESDLARQTVTVVATPTILTSLGLQPATVSPAAHDAPAPPPAFTDPAEQRVAQLAYDAFRKLAREPDKVPSVSYLNRPEVQALVVREVESQFQPAQLELEGVAKPKPDMAAVIAATAKLMAERTIDIPRIIVMPKGEVKAGFKPFTLDLSGMRYPTPSEELWAKHLRTDQVDVIGLSQGNLREERPEDYVVSGLIDFPDIAYDEHANLLYDLAGQVVAHLRTYLSEEETGQVLALHQREIARAVHAQMQDHFWLDDTVEYHHEVRQGWTELKESAFTVVNEPPLDFRQPPADKSNMARYLFGGFAKCLAPVTKFHSDSERKLAVILEREALKWLRPAKGQFQMYYRNGQDHLEYQPDFVAELDDCVVMLEPKAANQMTDKDVLAKRDVAVQWCGWASEHARTYGGKPWHYALIPHDVIAENMTLAFLLKQYEAKA